MAKLPAQSKKSCLLQMNLATGATKEQVVAEHATAGVAANATVLVRYSLVDFADISLTEVAASLLNEGARAASGDLGQLERMLASQAIALNAIFAEMARRGSLNMGEYLQAADTYMRLALRAQSQSKASIETLALIRQGPAVFARSANVVNGSQQVNVGTPAAGTLDRQLAGDVMTSSISRARGKAESCKRSIG